MWPTDAYRIVTIAGMYADRWLVVRERDMRVMYEGDVIGCLRWVNVWGFVHERGAALSPEAEKLLASVPGRAEPG